MASTRILLSGIAVTILVACGITAALRSRLVTDSPADLARQAIHDVSPKEGARAAARLAALAARSPAENAEELIACLTETLMHGRSPDVRATAVVGLARTGHRSVLPLLVATIEDEDPLVAGRAVAAVQHLLGVRYGVDERPFDQTERRRLAGMARADMAALDGPGKAWWESHTVQTVPR